jgi:hypothetical protein
MVCRRKENLSLFGAYLSRSLCLPFPPLPLSRRFLVICHFLHCCGPSLGEIYKDLFFLLRKPDKHNKSVIPQGLRDELNRLTSQGYSVDGKLHCFARGLALASILS